MVEAFFASAAPALTRCAQLVGRAQAEKHVLRLGGSAARARPFSGSRRVEQRISVGDGAHQIDDHIDFRPDLAITP